MKVNNSSPSSKPATPPQQSLPPPPTNNNNSAIPIPPPMQPPAAPAASHLSQPSQPNSSPAPSKSSAPSPPQPPGGASAFGPPLTPSRDYPTSQPPPPPPFSKRTTWQQYSSAPATSVAARLAPNPSPTEQPPQPQPPPPAASRGALPMGLSLENASSRILQSVHSLQRMPHGAPPNPHLSCNLLLPEGRPLALHSRAVPSLPVPQERIYQPSAPPPQPPPQPQAAPPASNAESYPQEQVAYQMNQVRDAQRINRVEGAATYPKPSSEYNGAPQRNLAPINSAPDQSVIPRNEVYPLPHQTAQNSQNSQLPGPDPQIPPPTGKAPTPINFVGTSAPAPSTTTPPKQSAASNTEIQPKPPQQPAEPEGKREPLPSTSNVEANGAPAAPPPQVAEAPGERRQLKVEDALHYLERVKYVFGQQPNVYNLFLDIMKEFKAQTIDTIEVIVRVSQLFQGHDQLILGFNRFLPPGYKIQIDRDEKTGHFIAGYEGPSGYSALNQTKSNIPLKPIAPHPAVGASGSARPQPRADSVKNTDRVTPQTPRQPASPSGTADKLSERARPASPRSPNRQNNSNSSPRAATKNDGDSHMVDASSPGRITSIPGPLVATEQQKIEGMNMACAFLDDMQSRPDGSKLFDRFIEITNEYKQGKDSERKKAMDLCNAVTDLLAGDKDLLTKFNRFLPVFYRTATNGVGDVAERLEGRKGGRRKNVPVSGPEALLFKKVREALGRGRSHLYTEFLKIVHLVSHKIISQEEFFSVVGELFRDVPAALDALRNIYDKETNLDVPTDGEEEFESESEEDEVDLAKIAEFKGKAISEIAAESTNIAGVSYRSLPKGFPQPSCSGRTPLEKATLNDHWVSVTQGSEEFTAKFMRRNPNEENLFRCEDDRYELDMIIETNASTILALEPIAATVTKLPNEAKRMHALVDGALNRIHYNAIQRIYGDKGTEVVMQVKLNPYAAIPVVLARLKEKDRHWRQARNKMNSVWRDVGEKNYYKAVDHRTTNFKICEKKELSTKTLISDLLDPTASLNARANELAKHRGYILNINSVEEGLVNDRSRSLEAVYESSVTGSGVLYIKYDDDSLHRTTFELVKMQVAKEVHDAGVARSIIRCFRKLICSFYGVTLEGDEGNSTRNPKDDSASILYGDEHVYVMMRLYDILYERLGVAKYRASKNAADQIFRNAMNEKGKKRVKGNTHLPETKTHPSELVQCFTATNAMKYFSIQPVPTDGEEIFNEYISTFSMFAQNPKTFTAEMYEEKVRVLLGPYGYFVFTLDKVLAKAGSLVIKCCGAESASRSYIDLFHEARSKSKGLTKRNNGQASKHGNTESAAARGGVQLPNDDAREFDRFYCAQATSTLTSEKGNGACLFRFEYVRRRKPQPANVATGLLAVTLGVKIGTETDEKKKMAIQAELDKFLGFSTSAEVAIAKNGKKKGEEGGDKRGTENRNNGKAKNRDGSSTEEKRGRRKRRRMSVDASPSFKKGNREASREREERRNENVAVSNGLEVEIVGNGSMSFVSGEDSLINRKRKWTFNSGKDNKKIGRVRKIEYASEKIASLFVSDEVISNNNNEERQDDAMDTESSSGSTDGVGENNNNEKEGTKEKGQVAPTCNNNNSKEDQVMAVDAVRDEDEKNNN